MCGGDYIWIAEADDLSLPGFLSSVVPALEHDSNVVFSYCQSQQIDENGEVMEPDYINYVTGPYGTTTLPVDHWKHARTSTLSEELCLGLAVKNTIPNVSAVVFRANGLREYLAESASSILSKYKIAGDWVVYVELLSGGRKLAYSPWALNKHRRHKSSLTLNTATYYQHLEEVISVQSIIGKQQPALGCPYFSVADAKYSYAQWLFSEHFKLADAQYPNVSMHPQYSKYFMNDNKHL